MSELRSYKKESYKSKPSGIRFNILQEKIAFAKSKTRTRQQLVDFLIDRYVNGETSFLETGEIHPQKQIATTTPIFKEEQKPVIGYKREKTVEQWASERMELVDAEQYNEWLAELNESALTDRQKNLAKTLTF